MPLRALEPKSRRALWRGMGSFSQLIALVGHSGRSLILGLAPFGFSLRHLK
jgi:hypothetical protein